MRGCRRTATGWRQALCRKRAPYEPGLGRALGIVAVILSTTVGTAIFGTFSESPSSGIRTAAGLLSVGAAVMAALQTFLGFAQRQVAHHESAVRYGALRRECEAAMSMSLSQGELNRVMSSVRKRWDEADVSAPAVSQRIWRSALKTVAEAEGKR